MARDIDRLIIPDSYIPTLTVIETENAIKLLKDHFEQELAKELNISRVSAPLFVRPETGLNDNLNGVERAVAFDVKGIDSASVEIVQSLAKWKRMALKKYGFKTGEGLYTDMNAIRRDEDLDNLHSVYVDQWDWEKVLDRLDRNLEYLKSTVRKIFRAIKNTESFITGKYPSLGKYLPDDIFFITTQELENLYPNLTPRQREDAISKEKKAVFIMQIGGRLKSGIKHDGRAPDYDDWNLNGDIVLWYPVLNRVFEISSMGVRVDEKALSEQLKAAVCEDRRTMPFHRDLLEGKLPCTIGGGIGQSRLCMFYLGKAHVGEVQASVWPEDMLASCEAANIKLL
ncbi:MAG: aspartate--ammonia ligase [Ruminiclostridium sp.]|nr:aspartate--ammonia ligase [Ruminiclostridium sp.]